ncbi:MAG: glycosyltransferase family 2 protein [Bacteroidales bacterium]|nr:glycosyltransferase family 2 protein [Bacteroidales bacterium]
MKKGLLITVNYNNWFYTESFIKTLISFGDKSIKIVIVDNSPKTTDNSISNLVSENENVVYLKTKKNIGYFGAVNYAIKVVDNNKYDYIIICNNDITIENLNFFEILNEKLELYDIIAPSIKTKENIQQNPHREKKIDFKRKILYKIYFSSYLIAKLINYIVRKKRIKQKEYNECEREIASPHGAFIILNKTFFSKGGFIDDGFFLYGEEDTIMAQAQKLKLKIGFVPDLKVKHFESLSTGKSFTKKKFLIQRDAHKYVQNKYKLYKIINSKETHDSAKAQKRM